MNNPPKNHHYVPQHFLKAWQSSKGEIIRHRLIPKTGKFEVKEVAIKKTASVDDLYRIQFPDGHFEIESLLVTPELDEDGHKILEKARTSFVIGWLDSDKGRLASYLTCLEARHPDVLESMNIGSDLNKMQAQFKLEGFASDNSIDEVFDYFKQSNSLGVFSFGLFLQNEKNSLLATPFAQGLEEANLREYIFNDDVLICTDYPTFRFGDYLKEFLLVVAISPRKALVYSSSSDIDFFGKIPETILPRLINLCSLAKSEMAYFKDSSISDFIQIHQGWSKKKSTDSERREYLRDFVCQELKAEGL